MANITGTQFNDLIHRNSDGQVPGGSNEFATATNNADSIEAGAGDDRVFASGGADTIVGDLGHDLLLGEGGNDNIAGGEGNDTILGGQGADNLSSGIGNDLVQIQQISDVNGLVETIDGGSDVDTLDFQSNNAIGAVNLSLATIIGVENLRLVANDVTLTAAQLGAFASVSGTGNIERVFLSAAGIVDLTNAQLVSIEEIRGSAGADQFILTGVASGQTINSLGGLDTLTGGNGDDALNGGDGADSVAGGSGNDALLGEAAADSVAGGLGNDIITGGAGIDTLTGDIGNDSFRIQFVGDVSGLAETINGGDDIDTIDFQPLGAGGAVNLSIASIIDVERLLLSGNSVTLTSAQLGAFEELGGTGLIERILIRGGGVADLTDASISSIEEIHGSAVANTINLTGVANFQTVFGEDGNDVIRGSQGGDLLNGGDGNDNMFGNQSGDTLIGGQGTDRLQGGVGNDSFDIQGVSDISGLAETVDGGADVDSLDFQPFNAFGAVDLSQVVFVGVEFIKLVGNDVTLTAAQMSAFDGFFGTGNTERLILSAAGAVDLTGTQFVGIEEIRGTAGIDSVNLTGVTTGLVVNGLAGTDTLTGSESGDALDGGAAADTISGNGGADRITGGLGRDSMTGGAAVDTFDFNDLTELGNAPATRDVITDFVHGQDVIDLADIDADTEVGGNQSFDFIGASAFTHVAGQLRYQAGVLSGDINGDNVADFQIQFTGAPVVTEGDIFR